MTPPSQDFTHHWKLFHEKAIATASNKSSTALEIQSLLDRLTQLLFGLDESLKAKAIGALALIITLVTSLPPSEEILLAALKAIKSCVIRNSIGRRRCRSAGIFEWLSSSADVTFDSKNPVIVEEAMTALAAMCMSNDLNSLQGAMQFRKHVNATTFSKEMHGSLHQKLAYLTALFDVMEREHAALVNEGDELWTHITKSERLLKAGVELQTAQKWDDAVNSYSQALDLITPYCSKTKLLDPLQWQLRFVRGTIRIKELSDTEELGLEDVNFCASAPDDEGLPIADVHALRATAFSNLGKIQDAKEAMAKAIIMGPKHAALTKWKEQLEIWESA